MTTYEAPNLSVYWRQTASDFRVPVSLREGEGRAGDGVVLESASMDIPIGYLQPLAGSGPPPPIGGSSAAMGWPAERASAAMTLHPEYSTPVGSVDGAGGASSRMALVFKNGSEGQWLVSWVPQSQAEWWKERGWFAIEAVPRGVCVDANELLRWFDRNTWLKELSAFLYGDLPGHFREP